MNMRRAPTAPSRRYPKRSCIDQPGLGCSLHLSGAAGALPADQVLGARTRPRRRGQGSAGKGRSAGQASSGVAHRVGWRVRQSAGRDQAAVDRGADQPCVDRRAVVVQFRLDGRDAARHERDPDGDLRRRARASDHGHSVQRLRGDRFYRAVRHRRDGRHHYPVAVQSTDR